MHVYVHVYIHKCMCACMHTCNFSLFIYIHACPHTYMHKYTCHTGVFSRTIKSLVHALGADSSMTEPTINSTLYAFIEQVNFYDLQKVVLQFATCFVSTMVYTYMVYTLYNKEKYLVQSSNMHSKINQINSTASNNNRQLPEDQCTVH